MMSRLRTFSSKAPKMRQSAQPFRPPRQAHVPTWLRPTMRQRRALRRRPKLPHAARVSTASA